MMRLLSILWVSIFIVSAPYCYGQENESQGPEDEYTYADDEADYYEESTVTEDIPEAEGTVVWDDEYGYVGEEESELASEEIVVEPAGPYSKYGDREDGVY